MLPSTDVRMPQRPAKAACLDESAVQDLPDVASTPQRSVQQCNSAVDSRSPVVDLIRHSDMVARDRANVHTKLFALGEPSDELAQFAQRNEDDTAVDAQPLTGFNLAVVDDLMEVDAAEGTDAALATTRQPDEAAPETDGCPCVCAECGQSLFGLLCDDGEGGRADLELGADALEHSQCNLQCQRIRDTGTFRHQAQMALRSSDFHTVTHDASSIGVDLALLVDMMVDSDVGHTAADWWTTMQEQMSVWQQQQPD